MSLKRVFVAFGAVLVLVCTFALNAFALPPNDPDITAPDEPYYMNDIGGTFFGDGELIGNDWHWSNTGIYMGQKSGDGLVGIDYDISAYAQRPVNATEPYYLYFDYARPHSNLGNASEKPRLYVWFAVGRIEVNGVVVGSNSSRAGFVIYDEGETMRFSSMSGGNVQYNDFSATYNKSDFITYDTSYWGEQTPVYSFRIEVNQEKGTGELQILTGNWFTTVKTVRLYEDATSTYNYNTLSFGTYDRIDGFSTSNQKTYGVMRISYIRYQDYNESYERAYSEAWQKAYDEGYDFGFSSGESVGHGAGYESGYKDGLLDGGVSEIDVPSVIDSVLNSTVTLFRNIFSFELFGINIAALIGSLTLIVVVAWIIRKAVR